MRGLYCSSHLTGDTVSVTHAIEGCLTENIAEGDNISIGYCMCYTVISAKALCFINFNVDVLLVKIVSFIAL